MRPRTSIKVAGKARMFWVSKMTYFANQSTSPPTHKLDQKHNPPPLKTPWRCISHVLFVNDP